MASNSKAELYAAIRRDVRGGSSIRAVERKYGVGYRTIRKALASVWPEPRKELPRRRTRLDPYHEVIDPWLRADLDARRKQRHTTTRISELRAENQQLRDALAHAHTADSAPAA